jgi:hypothetical protein
MNRYPSRFAGMALAAIASLCFLGTPSRAQFFNPSWRITPFMPNIPLGGFTTPYGSFYFGQAQTLSLYRVLPTGQSFSFNYSFYQAGLPVLNNYLVRPVYIGGGGGFGGGFNSISAGTYNPTLTRMQQDLGQAQMQLNQLQTTTPAARNEFDRWVADRSTLQANTDPTKTVDAALIHPSEDDILSGKVLNELAARIVAQEKAGKRATAALCPPELMEAIVFDGGPAADAANAFRVERLSFPPLLMKPELDAVRDELVEVYAPVSAAVLAGKRVESLQADKLLQGVKKARDATAAITKEAPVVDAVAVARFFHELENAAKFVKEPQSIGIVGSKWQSIGSNVSELVQHLTKFKIKFGRVTIGSESAYLSLHRGLLAYYASLSLAKK